MPMVHSCYLFDVSAAPYSQLRQKFCVEGLQLVHRGLLRRPADDETLSIARCGLGDDVEVDVVYLLMSNTTIVLGKHSVSIQQTSRVCKDADLQEVVVLRVQGKCDLLGRREDVREVLVGELMEFLRMICVIW